jgi:hypothetical protein
VKANNISTSTALEIPVRVKEYHNELAPAKSVESPAVIYFERITVFSLSLE